MLFMPELMFKPMELIHQFAGNYLRQENTSLGLYCPSWTYASASSIVISMPKKIVMGKKMEIRQFQQVQTIVNGEEFQHILLRKALLIRYHL